MKSAIQIYDKYCITVYIKPKCIRVIFSFRFLFAVMITVVARIANSCQDLINTLKINASPPPPLFKG